VAVISHRLWQQNFGGAVSVLGETVRIDGRSHEIVGVAPQGMLAHDEPFAPEVWTLLPERIRTQRGYIGLDAIARKVAGTTLPQIQGELDLVAERLVEQHPDNWIGQNELPRSLSVLSDRAGRFPPGQRMEVASMLAMLAAVVTLLLLISSSNVANLLLTRAWRRRPEIAVRLALGASRARLVSQLLTESILLALLAGASALLVIHAITTALLAGGWLIDLPAAIDLRVDWTVVGFAWTLSLLTGVVFGLVPALQASSPSLVTALKGTEQGERRRPFSIRNLLVVGQVAASLVLVFSSALVLRSLNEARQIDIGFDPENVALVSLDLTHGEYSEEEGIQFFTTLLDRLRSLPGAEGAALAQRVPLEGGSSRWGGVEPEGYELGQGEYLVIETNTVSPDYFELVRMPLLQGRDFAATDRVGEPKVLIVNQAFVDRFWPGEDGVGKRITIRDDYVVVGVIRNALYTSVTAESPPFIWSPAAQNPGSMNFRIHVRTSGDPYLILGAIREEVHALDPGLPIVGSNLMSNLSSRAMLPYAIISAILSAAGLVALTMATMGIYGVISYAVSQRTKEVGIRVAIGARRESVVGLVVREGLMMAAVGSAVALPVILVISQAAEAFVVGIKPLDPLSLVGGIGLLTVCAASAALIPVLRASNVDPMEALRNE